MAGALRWFPSLAGHVVAEAESVPAELRPDVTRLFHVRAVDERFPRSFNVLQHRPGGGRWDHARAYYSCECDTPSCAHIQAVLHYLGGADLPPQAA